MGNLFIGFPVPRAKIADMITGSAPPTVHHTQHEDGGKDEIDCSGLAGAGGIALPLNDIFLHQTIDAKNCLYQAVTGSAVITEKGDGVTMDTGTTVDSVAEAYKELWPSEVQLTWDKKRSVTLCVDFGLAEGGNDEYHLVSGSPGNTDHIGFKVIDSVLYGTCYEAAETELALTGGVNPDFVYSWYTLKFEHTPGEGVTFYVDGENRGTITTNVPAGTTNAYKLWHISAKILVELWRAAVCINNYTFWQEA